jgi:hypothetical protein
MQIKPMIIEKKEPSLELEARVNAEAGKLASEGQTQFTAREKARVKHMPFPDGFRI